MNEVIGSINLSSFTLSIQEAEYRYYRGKHSSLQMNQKIEI